MTPYQHHRNKWNDCELCDLCNRRKHVVLYRGKIPCDILYLGEAPGKSEDAVGKPFVGQAGHLLDRIVREALEESGTSYTVGFTNVVACIPRDAESWEKVHDPPKESVTACTDRLLEIVKLANPKLIVYVGTVAAKWGPKLLKTYSGKTANIIHPAAIMRAGVMQRGLLSRKCVITIRDILEEL